jgi:argininosuccinate lyase
MADLSRLAEEIVLWTSTEFGWARLDDRVSTGSSALPHKRNPDIAELVRGRAARVAGDLVAIVTLQKGLPLTYNRDLQEDKRIVFDADDLLAASIPAMAELLAFTVFEPPAPTGGVVSLGLAEALVRRGIPFREAHQAVGALFLTLDEQGREVGSATIEDLTAAHESFEVPDLALLDAVGSVTGPRSPGSGGPDSVRAQIAAIRRLVAPDRG